MGQIDFYAALGVAPEAGLKEIKSAYRKLAFKYHPDRNRDDPGAAEAMKGLNEAYAVLSDPGKRREYDELRRQFGAAAYERYRTRHTDRDIFSGSDINSIFEEMTRVFGFRGIDDVFRDYYGQEYRGFEFKRRRPSVRTFVFRRPLRPESGSGSSGFPPGLGGTLLRFLVRKLTGFEIPADGQHLREPIDLDPQLAAKGGPYAYHHRRLGKKLVIAVPKGIRPGQSIRLAGMGEPGKAGGRPGDLFLKVRLRRTFLESLTGLISDLLRKGGGGRS